MDGKRAELARGHALEPGESRSGKFTTSRSWGHALKPGEIRHNSRA